jgi:hypothetical protein
MTDETKKQEDETPKTDTPAELPEAALGAAVGGGSQTNPLHKSSDITLKRG